MERKLNLKRAPDDHRDKKFCFIAAPQGPEPRVVDLRPLDMPIADQGEIGACTAFAWAALHDFLRRKALSGKGTFKHSSRLFIYNNERIKAGTFNEDGGANMRDGGDVLHDLGVCPESMFPFQVDNLYKHPSDAAYAQALTHRNSTYYALDSIREMRQCLQEGYPFVLGIDVPEAMMNEPMSSTGRMSLRNWNTKSAGGHALMCCGYNDDKKEWLIRNSWSSDWGDKGYFYLPYSVMESEAATFNQYTLRL